MLHRTYEACFMHEANVLHMKHASCKCTSFLKHASWLYEACFIGVFCFTFASYMKHCRFWSKLWTNTPYTYVFWVSKKLFCVLKRLFSCGRNFFIYLGVICKMNKKAELEISKVFNCLILARQTVWCLNWGSESSEIWRPFGFFLITLFSETSQHLRQKGVLA